MQNAPHGVQNHVVRNHAVTGKKERQFDVQRRFAKMRDQSARKQYATRDQADQHRPLFAVLMPAVLMSAAAGIAVLVFVMMSAAAGALVFVLMPAGAGAAVLVPVMMSAAAGIAVLVPVMMLVFHKKPPKRTMIAQSFNYAAKKECACYSRR